MRWFLSILILGACVVPVPADPGPGSETVLRNWLDGIAAHIDDPTARPPAPHEHTQAAYAGLLLGERRTRYEKWLRAGLRYQELNEARNTYGLVPRQPGLTPILPSDHPELYATCLPLVPMLTRHVDQLSDGLQRDIAPHLDAALEAALRDRTTPQHGGHAYIAGLTQLLVVGAYRDNAGAVLEGQQRLARWLKALGTQGLPDHGSPDHIGHQLTASLMACDAVVDPDARAALRGATDTLWAYVMANRFGNGLAGPAAHCRDILHGRGVVDAYLTEGMPPAYPRHVVYAYAWGQGKTYRPSLLHVPGMTDGTRAVRYRWGRDPGQSVTHWLTPDYALGTTSCSAGPDDRILALHLDAERQLPIISFVADFMDSPYGTGTLPGREAPVIRHLRTQPAIVQHEGTVVGLVRISTDIQRLGIARHRVRRGSSSIASNLILPLGVDAWYVGGEPLDIVHGLDLADGTPPVVFVRQGELLVGVRWLGATTCAENEPLYFVKDDGRDQGAGRVGVYHYHGSPRRLDNEHVRVGFMLEVMRSKDDVTLQRAMRDFTKRHIDLTLENDVWRASTTCRNGITLDVALGLRSGKVLLREIDGRAVPDDLFSVNGQDIAALKLPPPLAVEPAHDEALRED